MYTGWYVSSKTSSSLGFWMFRKPAWAGYRSSPPAALTVGTESTGGFHQRDVSPCSRICTHLSKYHRVRQPSQRHFLRRWRRDARVENCAICTCMRHHSILWNGLRPRSTLVVLEIFPQLSLTFFLPDCSTTEPSLLNSPRLEGTPSITGTWLFSGHAVKYVGVRRSDTIT